MIKKIYVIQTEEQVAKIKEEYTKKEEDESQDNEPKDITMRQAFFTPKYRRAHWNGAVIASL